jgi:epoxyqueuosine reductase
MVAAHKQKTYAKAVKEKGKALGFDAIGIAEAGFLEEEAPLLEQWLNQGQHGKMTYMERNFDKRLDPRKLVDNAKSVISVQYNYFPGKPEPQPSNYKVSKYAYGRDYHKVLKKRLKELFNYIQEEIGTVNGRIFVDSAPVMDKAWAKHSGTGWQGKNSNILNKNTGSFFFLGELIIDLPLEPDAPAADHCGNCTKCIDACPTQAITPYKVDANKCISYLTIELKEQIPEEYHSKMEGWIFGCDICQDVCPWNKFAKPHKEPDFNPRAPIVDFNDRDWEEMTEEVFQQNFEGSPLNRAKLEGLMSNIKAAKKSVKKLISRT